MPTLQEILQDPNFVNANPATKQAIFDRWAPQDPNYSGANGATQQAIRQRFGIGGRFSPAPVEEKPAEDAGFFSNIGNLLVEGGQRALSAAEISPSVIAGTVGPEQAATITEELARKPKVQPKALTEAIKAFEDEAADFKKAEGFVESAGPVLRMIGEFGRQVITNPAGAVYLTSQSAANMVPAIAAGLAFGKAGTMVAGPAGGAVGFAGGMFAGSAPIEAGMEFTGLVGEELSRLNLPPTEANVARVLADEKFVEKAVGEARTKGATTAAIDAAFTAGAGRFATAPGRAAVREATAELGEGATKELVAKRADELLKDRTFLDKVGRGVGAVGIDVAGGGLSEAGGQLAAYGEVDLADVGLEMLGEIGGSAIEIPSAIQVMREPRQPAGPAAPPAITPPAPEAPVPPVAPAAPEAGVSTFTPERAITEEDIRATGIQIPSGFIPLMRRDFIGKTRADLQAFVDQNPEVLQNESVRSRLIRSLLQPQPAADQSGVGLPVQQPAGAPTGIGAPQPGAVDGVGGIAQPPVVPQAPVTPTVTEIPRGTTTPQAIEAEAQGQEDADAEPFPDIELPATPEESWNQMSQETRLKAAEQAGIANPKNLSNKNWGALSKNMRGRLEKTIASQQAVPFEETAPRQAQPRRPSEPKAPTIPPAENPQNIGALPGTTWEPGTTPETSLVSEGAVPFRNKTEARAARRLQPDMRVIKVPGGFVLSPKTEAQMEADRKAGERLGRARVGEAGRPLNAMQFIVDAGGLNRSAANNVPGVDPGRNMRVGNRWLVTQNGLSLDRAAELLQQAGYIDEVSESAAAAAMGNPDAYSPEGFNRLIEIEQAEREAEDAEIARMEEEEMAQWADFVEDPDSYLNTGYEEALAEIKAEVRDIIDRAEELNIDPEEIYENAKVRAADRAQQRGRESVTDEDYILSAREELRDVLARSPEDRRPRDGQPRQEVPDLELAPPTPEAQAEAERRAEEAAKAEEEAAKEAEKAQTEERKGRERKEIEQRSAGAAGDFQLGQTAEQNLSGQKDIFFSTPSQVSPIEEKQSQLQAFEANLLVSIPKFSSKDGSGRVTTITPKALTPAEAFEIVSIASDAIDLGMPASLLENVKAGGTARVNSNAAIVQPDGWLLIGRGWASKDLQQKTHVFIHEMAHTLDYGSGTDAQHSSTKDWDVAHKELKGWYEKAVKDHKAGAAFKHPLSYPFSPSFRGKARMKPESFAQAFALYFTSPSELQSNAPAAYGQIQSILQGVQNESQRTGRASQTASEVSGVEIQPTGTKAVERGKPRDGEVVSGGRPAQGVADKDSGAVVSDQEQAAIDRQEANVPSIWGGNIKPAFVVDEEVNWFERFIMQPLINRNYDVRNVYQSIKKAGIDLDKRFDFDELEITASGMEAQMEQDFIRDEVDPILKEMMAKKVEFEDIHNYMLAKHAEERNIEVARRNPNMPDGGSGMKTQEARDYLNSLSPERKKDLEAIAKRLDDIQDVTREIIVDTGQEKAETVESWTKKFKNYVPLFREEMEYDDMKMPGQGTGVSVRGDFSRSFTGSSKPVQDVFASIIAQRQRAIARGMKMRQGRGIFGAALSAPAPNFWMAVDPRSTKMEQVKRFEGELAGIRAELEGVIDDPVRRQKLEERVPVLQNRIDRLKPEAIKELDDMLGGLANFGLSAEEVSNLLAQPFEAVYSPTSGMVEYRPNKLMKSPYVITTRINGEEVYVFFNKQNERARRMAEQLHNMGTEPMDLFNRIMAPITRFFAAINTQYNPIWGTYNYLRDSQTAAIQAGGTVIEDVKMKVVHEGFKNLPGIYKMLRDERKGKPNKSDVAKAFKELREQGGTTGFLDNFSRQEDRVKALADQVKLAQAGKIKKFAVNNIAGLVSDFNQSLENSIRLAAYMEAKKKYVAQYMAEGMSKEAAEIRAKQPSAVVAKQITVNFNQKGGLNAKIGSFYAFFNAAMQGLASAGKAMFTWDKPGDFKSIRLTPMGKKVMIGGLMWGAMQPLLLMMFGIDPDELEEYQKERNFMIPIGDGKVFIFPMPFVFSMIPNTSRLMTEWFVNDMKDGGKYLTNFASAMMNSFNPFGGQFDVLTFTPTPLKPIIALDRNVDAFGRPIAKEAFNQSQQVPGYTMARDSASAFGKIISEYVNYLSGGTKDVAGALNWTPDQVDYFIGQLTGGIGREVLKATQVTEGLFTGEAAPFYKYPLIGRFGTDVNEGGAVSQKFYSNLTKLNAYENTVKGMRERREPLTEYLNENPLARMYQQANVMEREIQKMRKTMKQLREKNDKEGVKRMQERIKERMQKFNQRVKEIEDR